MVSVVTVWVRVIFRFWIFFSLSRLRSLGLREFREAKDDEKSDDALGKTVHNSERRFRREDLLSSTYESC